ncbi:hypothetical protein M422DRAFT_243023 [Sphaerobolus stellatus SS14]|nr:hypothetical protein M422DRAFT_243023 [Sphaerobolus stellatus SS14]
MPADFYRQPASVSFEIIQSMVNQIFAKYSFTPGANKGKHNYVLSPKTPALSDFWGIYKDVALRVVPDHRIYPRPSPEIAKGKYLCLY